MSSLADLAETAMARSVGRGTMFDLKLSFISPADGEESLTATARVIHSGRRTVVTDCRIEAADGRLVAMASATFAVPPEGG